MTIPDSILLRLERASEHLDGLKAESTRCVAELERDSIVREIDPDTGEHVWRLQAPPDLTRRISVLTGDFVHNLRCALDYIAWELSSERTRRPLPEFPIFTAPGPGNDGFHGAGIPKIWSMPLEARAVVESLQPYHRGNDPLLHIHQLDNIDKHRRLVTSPRAFIREATISSAPFEKYAREEGAGEFVVPFPGLAMKLGLINDGDEIRRLPGTFSAKEIEAAGFGVSFELTLQEERIADDIMAQLPRLYEFVQKDVLPRFEPFF